MIIRTSSKDVIASGIVPSDATFQIVGPKNSSLTKWGIKVGETGEGDSRTATWLNCTAWNRIADEAKTIQKGDSVLICGTEATRSYVNRDGENKQSTETTVDFFSVLKTTPREPLQTTEENTKAILDAVEDDKDLPF